MFKISKEIKVNKKFVYKIQHISTKRLVINALSEQRGLRDHSSLNSSFSRC
jgi:hypothetical protein